MRSRLFTGKNAIQVRGVLLDTAESAGPGPAPEVCIAANQNAGSRVGPDEPWKLARQAIFVITHLSPVPRVADDEILGMAHPAATNVAT